MFLLTEKIATTTLNFKAYQVNPDDSREVGIDLNLSFELPEFDASKSKVCGTLLNELFRWVELQRELKADGLKLNLPILLKFDVAGIKFDTGTVRKQAQQRLKLQNTPKGRKAYAKKFWATFNYATAKIETKTYAELVAGLETAIMKAA